MSDRVRHHLLLYDYVEDILERRGPLREEHLQGVRRWQEQGKIVIAGAYGDPVRGAAFVFEVPDRAEVEAFVEQDPYMRGGLVEAWRVEPYTVVTR